MAEWVHCICIHTIVDERLGIPENKAMRLLTTTFFTLLLIGSAGGSYGQTVETINYADGDIYAGEWKDGQQNGLGGSSHCGRQISNQ
jgi:hypothetical protein